MTKPPSSIQAKLADRAIDSRGQQPSFPRPAKTTKGGRTRNQILDAAERQFAEHGFDGVSMRIVADSASVLVGLVTYHFPTKVDLFHAVVQRRADQLNRLRTAEMDALQPGDLEGLLRSFAEPYLTLILSGDDGWRSYTRLIAQVSQDATWAQLGEQQFGTVARRFIALLVEAVPGLERDTAVRAYVHTLTVIMGTFASSGLVDRFSDGRLSSKDLAETIEPMIKFLVGGIGAMASAGRPEWPAQR